MWEYSECRQLFWVSCTIQVSMISTTNPSQRDAILAGGSSILCVHYSLLSFSEKPFYNRWERKVDHNDVTKEWGRWTWNCIKQRNMCHRIQIKKKKLLQTWKRVLYEQTTSHPCKDIVYHISTSTRWRGKHQENDPMTINKMTRGWKVDYLHGIELHLHDEKIPGLNGWSQTFFYRSCWATDFVHNNNRSLVSCDGYF